MWIYKYKQNQMIFDLFGWITKRVGKMFSQRIGPLITRIAFVHQLHELY